MDFWNGESPQNRTRNAPLLATMRNGDRAEWDCTTLFYAILYSDCIRSLHPAVQSNVDDLRKLRYEEFAHMPRGYLSSGDFQNVILKVNTSFHALGLSNQKIREIQNQTSFPREELRSVLKKVGDLQQEVQEKETKLKEKDKEPKEKEKELEEKEIQRQTLEQLQAKVPPICILPPKPAHGVSPRGSEVDKITQHLKALRAAKNDSFRLQIFGSPGIGKSPVALLKGKRFLDECKEKDKEPKEKEKELEEKEIQRQTLEQLQAKVSPFCILPPKPAHGVSPRGSEVDKITQHLKALRAAKNDSFRLQIFGSPGIGKSPVALLKGKRFLDECKEKDKEPKEKDKEPKEKEKELEEKEIQRQTLEQLQAKVSPFCILPPKPAHGVSPRGSEVDKITQHLKALRAAKNDSFSTLYLSGNPGSGKSQLARLTAMRFFDECKETPCAISFVMTLNAESSETLLESYASFARHCKCPHYSVTNITSSKYLSTDEKIASLKTLISTKIGLYTSWLLVVDNVTNLSHVHTYLPDSGNQQWERGQLLITTQDTTRIPLTSSSIQHISISEGMLPEDASSMLRLLSDVTDDGTEKEIARSLDYQPLALASAAIYVRQVHEGNISNFGWDDYLKKLEKGQQRTTESLLAETNPSYPKTMTAAITIALEKAMSSDRVINHLFTFLSLCAPEPILKDIVINYIMKMEGEFEDKDAIGEKISRCPLLLFDEEESGVYIRVHGVVRYVVNSVTKKSAKEKKIKSVLGAVLSFSKFKDQESRVIGTKIVPHLAKVITDAEYLFSREGISQIVKISAVTLHDYSEVLKNLGKMCYEHSQYPAAKSCFTAALAIIKLGDPSNDLEKTAIYSQLGLVHSQLGDLRQAKDCHERALDVYLKKLGLEHKRVAASYNNLGLVHCQLSDLNQAKNCYERALDVYLKKLGPEHVNVATCYDNLGLVHRNLGDLKQAKDCHERALDVYMKNLGLEHEKVAASYNNLGLLHRQLGDLEQARDCHERALDVYSKHLGPEHVNVVACYDNLCFIYSQLGDLKHAKDCHERALDVYMKNLGL